MTPGTTSHLALHHTRVLDTGHEPGTHKTFGSMLPVERTAATAKDATHAKNATHAKDAKDTKDATHAKDTSMDAGITMVSAMVATNSLVSTSAADATGTGFSADKKSRALTLMYELFEQERSREGRPLMPTHTHLVHPCPPRRGPIGSPPRAWTGCADRQPATGVDEVPSREGRPLIPTRQPATGVDEVYFGSPSVFHMATG